MREELVMQTLQEELDEMAPWAQVKDLELGRKGISVLLKLGKGKGKGTEQV